ncbi:hypothetical protein D3C85_1667420 [compost metagenome]
MPLLRKKMRRKGIDLRVGFEAVEHRHEDRVEHGEDHDQDEEHHYPVDDFVACFFQIMFGENPPVSALHVSCPPCSV